MYKREEYLDSVKYIQGRLQEELGLFMKPSKLMHLLHHHLGMRYKRVQEISWKANDPKNLVLRQQFAQAFLKIDLHSKIILNVDETWLGMSDFRRRKWTFMDRPDSVKKKQVQPRVSMITGLDTRGSLYISLVQANSNSSVM